MISTKNYIYRKYYSLCEGERNEYWLLNIMIKSYSQVMWRIHLCSAFTIQVRSNSQIYSLTSHNTQTLICFEVSVDWFICLPQIGKRGGGT